MNHESAPRMRTKGIQISVAFCSQTWLCTPARVMVWPSPTRLPNTARPIIQGVTNCTRLTPKLPMPAWIASAVPCSRFGKNRLVEGMKDEKLPPPRPAMKASSISTQYGVAVFCTATAQPARGTSREAVDSATTCRVPKSGVKNMWSSRSVPPARPGIAVSQNS